MNSKVIALIFLAGVVVGAYVQANGILPIDAVLATLGL